MIYPRGTHTPPPTCQFCKGTGMVQGEHCSECNGTGIPGNPSVGFIVMFLVAAVFWTAVVLLVR